MSSPRFVGAALSGLLCLSAGSSPAVASPSYQDLVKAYVDDGFRVHPSQASFAGLHDYDSRLDDVSPAAHAAEIKRLKTALAGFDAVDPATLDPGDRDDREVLIGQIKGALLYEERVPTWRTNPDLYTQLATSSVFALVQRNFAPLPERMRSAIARERQIPAMLATAEHTLRDSPRAFVEIALQNVGGAVDFFKTGAPQAFAEVADTRLQQEFTAANKAVLKALEAYGHFLESDLLPRARGNFALGAEALAEHLADFDLVDVPLDRLREVAWAHLRAEQSVFAETAHRVDPTGTLEQAIARLQSDHPKPDGLVAEASNELAGLKQFILDHRILTIPPEADLRVAETPGFARALVIAEFDPPGPLEQHAREAFYYVTPPSATLTAKQTDEYLGAFDYSDFLVTSAHEVWPGHYMQFLTNKAHPEWSLVRKLVGVQSTTEGWAHYSEQMMVDAGLGDAAPLLRLGQLEEALLRDCRMVASLEMHLHGMTVEEATRLFVKECYVPEPAARPEAYRGTSDPGYMTYTLGKLAILKLREDYRQKLGDKFTLGDFHDRFLAAGLVPIRIIRRELLGAEGDLL
jgi:uncharacterized protein (DUF885 family)